MKYQPTYVEKEGKWFVGIKRSTKYFIHGGWPTKEEAEQHCIIRELYEHYDKAQAAYDLLEKRWPDQYGGHGGKTTFHDLLA